MAPDQNGASLSCQEVIYRKSKHVNLLEEAAEKAQICSHCSVLLSLPFQQAAHAEFFIDEPVRSLLASPCCFCLFFLAVIVGHHDGIIEDLPHPSACKVSMSWHGNFGYGNHTRVLLDCAVNGRWTEYGAMLRYDVPDVRQRPQAEDSYVDYQTLSAWLADCTAHEVFRLSLDGVPSNLKVIRCKGTPDVICAPEQCRYVALSYVWGDLQESSYGVGDEIGNDAPQTIKDSIEVTLRLGFEYLWIDRYVWPIYTRIFECLTGTVYRPIQRDRQDAPDQPNGSHIQQRCSHHLCGSWQ